MRTQFALYKSFDDVYQDLNDKQKIEFIDTLFDVQFLRVKIEDVTFKDVILKHIWNAQKHSLEKSINGYIESQKNSKIKNPFLGCYDDNFLPIQLPSEGNHKEEEVKGEEEGKGKEEVKGIIVVPTFSFTLSKDTHFSKLSDEYISKLKDKIYNFNGALSFEDFEMALLSKSTYKYKDFWLTYQNWNKRENSKQQPKSFKQQDKEKASNTVDTYMNNNFNIRNHLGLSEQEVEVISYDRN